MTAWQKADNLVDQVKVFLSKHEVDSSLSARDGQEGVIRTMGQFLRNFMAVTKDLQEYISYQSLQNSARGASKTPGTKGKMFGTANQPRHHGGGGGGSAFDQPLPGMTRCPTCSAWTNAEGDDDANDDDEDMFVPTATRPEANVAARGRAHTDPAQPSKRQSNPSWNSGPSTDSSPSKRTCVISIRKKKKRGHRMTTAKLSNLGLLPASNSKRKHGAVGEAGRVVGARSSTPVSFAKQMRLREDDPSEQLSIELPLLDGAAAAADSLAIALPTTASERGQPRRPPSITEQFLKAPPSAAKATTMIVTIARAFDRLPAHEVTELLHSDELFAILRGHMQGFAVAQAPSFGTPSGPPAGSAAGSAALRILRLLASNFGVCDRFSTSGVVSDIQSMLCRASEQRPFSSPSVQARDQSPTPRASPSFAETEETPGWSFGAQMVNEGVWCLGNLLKLQQEQNKDGEYKMSSFVAKNSRMLNPTLVSIALLGHQLLQAMQVDAMSDADRAPTNAPAFTGIYNGSSNSVAASASTGFGDTSASRASPTQYMLQMTGRYSVRAPLTPKQRRQRLQQQTLRQLVRTGALLLQGGTTVGNRISVSQVAMENLFSFAAAVILRRAAHPSMSHATETNFFAGGARTSNCSAESTLAVHDALSIFSYLVECARSTDMLQNSIFLSPPRGHGAFHASSGESPFIDALLATMNQKTQLLGPDNSSDDIVEQQVAAMHVLQHALRVAPRCVALGVEHRLQQECHKNQQDAIACPATWTMFAHMLSQSSKLLKRSERAPLVAQIIKTLTAFLGTRSFAQSALGSRGFAVAPDPLLEMTDVARMLQHCPTIFELCIAQIESCPDSDQQQAAAAAIGFLTATLEQLYREPCHIGESQSGGAISKLLVGAPFKALVTVLNSLSSGGGGYRAGASPEYVLLVLRFLRSALERQQRAMSAMTSAAASLATRHRQHRAYSNPNSPVKPNGHGRSFPGESDWASNGASSAAGAAGEADSDSDGFVLVSHGVPGHPYHHDQSTNELASVVEEAGGHVSTPLCNAFGVWSFICVTIPIVCL